MLRMPGRPPLPLRCASIAIGGVLLGLMPQQLLLLQGLPLQQMLLQGLLRRHLLGVKGAVQAGGSRRRALAPRGFQASQRASDYAGGCAWRRGSVRRKVRRDHLGSSLDMLGPCPAAALVGPWPAAAPSPLRRSGGACASGLAFKRLGRGK